MTDNENPQIGNDDMERIRKEVIPKAVASARAVVKASEASSHTRWRHLDTRFTTALIIISIIFLSGYSISVALNENHTSQLVKVLQQKAQAPTKSILGTSNLTGHLIVTYTDGTREDFGALKTPAQDPNMNGVEFANVNSAGHLILTMTNLSITDVGRVVGKDGLGVKSISLNAGRLIVSYTDGTTQDAGPVPNRPDCPLGTKLEPVTYTNGITGQGCVDLKQK